MADYSKMNEAWALFRNKLDTKIKPMYSEKRNLEVRKNQLMNTNKIITISRNNVDRLLANKKLFLDLDNSLSKYFDVINYFKQVGKLDNSAVQSTIDAIYSSPVIVGIIDGIKELDDQIFDLDLKIKELELLKNNNYNKELLESLFDEFELDNMTRRHIIMYAVNSVSKETKKVVQKPKINRDLNVVEEEQEEVIEKDIPEEIDEEDNYNYGFDEYYDNYERGGIVRSNSKKTDINRLTKEYKRTLNRYDRLIVKYMVKHKKLDNKTLDEYADYCTKHQKYNKEFCERYSMLLIHNILNVKEAIDILRDVKTGKVNDEVISELYTYINKFKEYLVQLDRTDRFLTTLEKKNRKEKVVVEEKHEEVPTEEVKEETTELDQNSYKSLSEKYNDIKKEYATLLNEYGNFASISTQEINVINSYKDTFEQGFDIEGVNPYEINANASAIETFKSKGEVDDYFGMLRNKEADDLEFLEELINEFNDACHKLQEQDSLYKRSLEVNENDIYTNNVFFLMDNNGKLIEPEYVDYDDIYKLLAKRDVDADSHDTVFPDVKDKDGRTVCVKKISKSNAYGYLIVDYPNGINHKALLILDVTHLRDGYEKLRTETTKIVDEYKDLIQEQTRLIETNNRDYILLQETIKESFGSPSRGV